MGEREIFAKIFDQMLSNPVLESSRQHRTTVKSKKVEGPSRSVAAKSKRGLAAALDDSSFLTTKEVAEYPEGLRPLAAKIVERVKTDETLSIQPVDWVQLEQTMDEFLTDLDLSRYLEETVFPTMQDTAKAQSPIHGNYSFILLKAMRLFRLTFHNPLAAHTLFLRAKTLSAESYVLGCTTQL
jgi:hypothetical protein